MVGAGGARPERVLLGGEGSLHALAEGRVAIAALATGAAWAALLFIPGSRPYASLLAVKRLRTSAPSHSSTLVQYS